MYGKEKAKVVAESIAYQKRLHKILKDLKKEDFKGVSDMRAKVQRAIKEQEDLVDRLTGHK